MNASIARLVRYAAALILATSGAFAHADEFSDTATLFKNSNESAAFFDRSYGYAVFPTIGEGGLVVAGGYGTGRVFVRGRAVGDATVTQLSVGAQGGGQAYSQIIFFQNQRAFNAFTSGKFEFAADASAVAITAAAQASAGTQGANAGVSGIKKNAGTLGGYRKGVAVFTIVKGGAMLQAAIGGQKFTYKPTGR